MKVLHINYYDSSSGSGVAAFRLHKALQNAGVESEMLVMQKENRDHSVKKASFFCRAHAWIYQRLAARILRLQKSSNPFSHSLNHFPNPVLRAICKSDADVVHLHWIGGEMLSVKQVAKINKPLLWTLHDSWAFCGTEHCLNVLQKDPRFREGYTKENRPSGENGPDLSRWNWEKKQKSWNDLKAFFVTPGQWMNHCRSESLLLGKYPGLAIPNCVDLDLFSPGEKAMLRRSLGLDPDSRVILAGSQNLKDPLKGMAYLRDALCLLPETIRKKCVLLTFGSGDCRSFFQAGEYSIALFHQGTIREEESMARLYQCADVFVCPSLVDNFPNTVLEASACGVPCAAFRTGGLPEMICHRETGFLSTLPDPASLAQGIVFCLEHQERLSAAARAFALTHYAPSAVAQQYVKVYEKVLTSYGKNKKNE